MQKYYNHANLSNRVILHRTLQSLTKCELYTRAIKVKSKSY